MPDRPRTPMIPRTYKLPYKYIDEDNCEWCRRAADSIPDEALRAIADELANRLRMSRGWPHVIRSASSHVGDITGHGSGVSMAITERLGLKNDQGPTP